MRAITICQPWAWAIIHGGKTVENRTRLGTWAKLAGQTVAVHAGQRWSERGAATIPTIVDGHLWDSEDIVQGAVIGTVFVADVHLEAGGCCAPWGETSYTEVREHRGTGARAVVRHDLVHLVLANPRPLDVPIRYRGNLGPWKLPDRITAAVLDQVGALA